MVTSFDIKADVLVSIALIASVIIGEDFAAGEVAFIMQLGGLLEEMTVARARAGIERLVHLTPRTARRIQNGKETVILQSLFRQAISCGFSWRDDSCGRRDPERADIHRPVGNDWRASSGG